MAQCCQMSNILWIGLLFEPLSHSHIIQQLDKKLAIQLGVVYSFNSELVQQLDQLLDRVRAPIVFQKVTFSIVFCLKIGLLFTKNGHLLAKPSGSTVSVTSTHQVRKKAPPIYPNSLNFSVIFFTRDSLQRNTF